MPWFGVVAVELSTTTKLSFIGWAEAHRANANVPTHVTANFFMITIPGGRLAVFIGLGFTTLSMLRLAVKQIKARIQAKTRAFTA